MLIFSEDVKLKKWFGEFGGDVFDNDFQAIHDSAETIEKILCTEIFAEKFREILEIVLPKPLEIRRRSFDDQTELILFPAYGKYYSIAGQLALAQIQNKKKIYTAAYSGKAAEAIAKACHFLGMELKIILGRELSSDQERIAYMESLGAEVDSKTSTDLLDLPHYYLKPMIKDPVYSSLLYVTANYGTYPYPSLVGELAGIYGRDLRELLTEVPDCLVVPIEDGTEAIALFKAFLNDGCALVTVEEPISQEYHLIDCCTYTISTRSADREQRNTTICPELANWWREGRVMRLGCDRIKPVDISKLGRPEISPSTARAVSLACERTTSKKMLVMEVTD